MAKLLATLVTLIVIGIGVLLSQTTTWVFQAEASEAETTVLENQTISFYSSIDSCHYFGCPTASGVRPYVGSLACPRAIALKTVVQILGEYFTCEDRTARFVDGRFDLFTGYGEEAHQNALEMGILKETVIILN